MAKQLTFKISKDIIISMVKHGAILIISIIFFSVKPSWAEDKNHKGIDIKGYAKKCDTKCHTPENVKKAKEDKVKVDKCKECHVGPDGEDIFGNMEQVKKAALKMSASEGTGVMETPKDMVLIPAGNFLMGTDERWDDEGPQYTLFLKDYYMDIYEVSNGDYKRFVDATGHRKPNHWKGSSYPPGKKDHPVTYVSWYDADAYCRWAGKRLPTQEEWEKAARGTDGRNYPWGKDFDPERSNNPLKKSTGTEPVDSYENGRSPYGIYNLSGNVWEWTASWYKAYPNSTRSKDTYGEKLKVLKGGSWYNCSSYDCGISAPVFNRAPFEPDVKSNSFGFRCAKD